MLFYYDVKRYYVGWNFFNYNLLPMHSNIFSDYRGLESKDIFISYIMIMLE
ncbi:hypothetical protein HMPREF6485_2517 [Segatella buccae ATCC 33574]|uniref:Uncharacterized protein n=1 Tax=Segatella buccae ATCC 33574 TaxID=873513 RepID=E6KA81_9BACT|nr:hypothetical protein HMPREF6485_2517 [Segatella buccae ATCC 33574]